MPACEVPLTTVPWSTPTSEAVARPKEMFGAGASRTSTTDAVSLKYALFQYSARYSPWSSQAWTRYRPGGTWTL